MADQKLTTAASLATGFVAGAAIGGPAWPVTGTAGAVISWILFGGIDRASHKIDQSVVTQKELDAAIERAVAAAVNTAPKPSDEQDAESSRGDAP